MSPLMVILSALPRVEAEVCKIIVSTNIVPKCQWEFPIKFFKIPEIGDYIEAVDGNARSSLRVCAITYLMNGDIRIELSTHC